MYVCLKAWVNGFKHCKPLIGLDGCHLKKKFGRQLLAAIEIDVNDYIFLVDFAVVELKIQKHEHDSSTNWIKIKYEKSL